MNANTTASAQLETVRKMGEWLERNTEYRERLNNAIFSVSNAMGVHPHDLAIFILMRTNRL